MFCLPLNSEAFRSLEWRSSKRTNLWEIKIVGKLPQLRLQRHHAQVKQLKMHTSWDWFFSPKFMCKMRCFFTFIEIAVSQTVFFAMVAKTKLHCLTHLSSLGLFLGRGRRWCVRFGIPFFGRGFPCCLSLRFPFSLRFGFRFHFHSFGHQPWYWKSIPTKVLPTWTPNKIEKYH